MFEGSYVDPFDMSDPPEQLVNIATGAAATQDGTLGQLCNKVSILEGLKHFRR